MKKETGRRHLQIGEGIKRRLARMFREGRFEHKIQRLFLITEVKVSRGFETAHVFISAIEEGKSDEVAAALNAISGEIRYELAHESELRSTPALAFKADEALANANRIEGILSSEKVRRDLS